jgi:hypothetical protein
MSKHDVKVYEIKVGCMLFGTIRDNLTRLKMKGHDLHWKEGSGWLSKKFFISGSDALAFCRKVNEMFG